jgi:hypothetical protein
LMKISVHAANLTDWPGSTIGTKHRYLNFPGWCLLPPDL